MSQVAHADQSSDAVCPPLPLSAGAVGAFGILGELARLADQGLRSSNPGTPISMMLTALLVVWFSYGVLSGRTVRLVLVAIVLGLSALSYAWDILTDWDGYAWPLLHLALTLAMTGALVALVRSPFHAWQRRHHDLVGVPIVGVMLLAAVCGVLGPLPDQPEPDIEVSVNF
jgi:hypothetical protein